jgi:hypothetical protein
MEPKGCGMAKKSELTGSILSPTAAGFQSKQRDVILPYRLLVRDW